MILISYSELSEENKITAIDSWRGSLSFEYAKELLESDPLLAYFNAETGEFEDETEFEEY